MKTCKSGLHQYEPVKGSETGCPACHRACRARHEKSRATRLPEKTKAKNARRQIRYPRAGAARKKAWRKKNPEQVAAAARLVTAKATDSYIARLFLMPVKDIPIDMLQAKREQLQIYRALRSLNNQIKEMQK